MSLSNDRLREIEDTLEMLHGEEYASQTDNVLGDALIVICKALLEINKNQEAKYPNDIFWKGFKLMLRYADVNPNHVELCIVDAQNKPIVKLLTLEERGVVACNISENYSLPLTANGQLKFRHAGGHPMM